MEHRSDKEEAPQGFAAMPSLGAKVVGSLLFG
jgi:hypothetical protein